MIGLRYKLPSLPRFRARTLSTNTAKDHYRRLLLPGVLRQRGANRLRGTTLHLQIKHDQIWLVFPSEFDTARQPASRQYPKATSLQCRAQHLARLLRTVDDQHPLLANQLRTLRGLPQPDFPVRAGLLRARRAPHEGVEA